MPIPAGLANRTSYRKSFQWKDHRIFGVQWDLRVVAGWSQGLGNEARAFAITG